MHFGHNKEKITSCTTTGNSAPFCGAHLTLKVMSGVSKVEDFCLTDASCSKKKVLFLLHQIHSFLAQQECVYEKVFFSSPYAKGFSCANKLDLHSLYLVELRYMWEKPVATIQRKSILLSKYRSEGRMKHTHTHTNKV